MREIKFRAWVKNKKQMYPVSGLALMGDKWINLETGFALEPNMFAGVARIDSPNVELMQYTGLKDKNGVEIYEGDIIKTKDSFGEKESAIAWSDQMMGWVPKIPLESEDKEIVGNIYEKNNK